MGRKVKSGLLLVFLVLSVAATSDMCPNIVPNAIYAFANLPYDCLHSFHDCPTAMCACAGLSFDPTALECSGTRRSSSTACEGLDVCIRDYVSCVNTQFGNAEELGLTSNCSAGETSLSFFHDQALLNVVNPTEFNTSDLFVACEDFKCFAENLTACTGTVTSSESVCVPPAGYSTVITPVPGSTPAPTNGDGSFTVPTKIVKLVVTFNADFDSLVSTAVGKQKITDTMTTALTKKISYKTVAKSFKYTFSNGSVTSSSRKHLALAAGTLVVNGEATIPASDTSTLNSVLANVQSLQNDRSTGWFAALAAACGCVIPPPTVTSSVVDGFPSTPSGPASSACGPGCIAGIVIGAVVFVVIVVAVVLIVIRKFGQNKVSSTAIEKKEPTDPLK